jgi:hypothetical protein
VRRINFHLVLSTFVNGNIVLQCLTEGTVASADMIENASISSIAQEYKSMNKQILAALMIFQRMKQRVQGITPTLVDLTCHS